LTLLTCLLVGNIYPFEVGESVWIMKPAYRALLALGEFRITKALPDDKFELGKVSGGSLHLNRAGEGKIAPSRARDCLQVGRRNLRKLGYWLHFPFPTEFQTVRSFSNSGRGL